MAYTSKKLKAAKAKFDSQKQYSLSEAISLVKQTSITKFDGTIDVAFNLNVDPRHADQQIRGAMVLPGGTGKSQKVLVITKTKEAEAKAAGADFVGGEEMIDRISKENWFEFDVIVATPEVMAQLGKIGKLLGPKGLMPNPKTGTVTPNVANAINEIKKGKVEYRTDKEGNIHSILGKVSFSNEDITKNFNALFDVIKRAKPVAVKGAYIQNISISSTMGPGIKVAFDQN
ncbi:50S ribosomal protein L1 [Spiroplasma sp. TIUS-1]|uniref:50S ribosomal protein L1 n=1 Tax=Spiroplasma sp. TIUS-1 TaxID=216963 RepID=UPI0013975DDF|nr:50S ribosomal protein L1 [Spiroplasma sp. TIUS-1]QHX35589.1 50S ribosomal protein L1 [Spiroplasma sp. TIUS-1]